MLLEFVSLSLSLYSDLYVNHFGAPIIKLDNVNRALKDLFFHCLNLISKVPAFECWVHCLLLVLIVLSHSVFPPQFFVSDEDHVAKQGTESPHSARELDIVPQSGVGVDTEDATSTE